MRKVLYILGLLKDEDIDWLVAVGQTDSVTAGEALIREGEAFDSVYILLEGTLRVSIVEQQDKELARLGPGEMVGEISMLDSRPPSATVTAATDVQVLRVPRTDLVAKLKTDKAFSARFYRAIGVFLAQRLRNTVARLGYGDARDLDEDVENSDDIDPELLDTISLAGKRFEEILNRLKGGPTADG
jgi:bacteriocin-type transport-associated protein